MYVYVYIYNVYIHTHIYIYIYICVCVFRWTCIYLAVLPPLDIVELALDMYTKRDGSG